MAVFPAPLRAAAPGASRSVCAAAARRSGEWRQPRSRAVLRDSCLHRLQPLPQQIGEKVREELMSGLRMARDQAGNSTKVLNEWDLLQEKVGAQEANPSKDDQRLAKNPA